jgi:adenylate cyclase
MKNVIIIALWWTAIDFLAKFLFSGSGRAVDMGRRILTPQAAWLRVSIVFSASALMAYLLVFRLREAFRDQPLWKNWLFKTSILVGASLGMNFLIHISYYLIVWNLPPLKCLSLFWSDSIHTQWLVEKSVGWMMIFILTQLFLEVNAKYGPGVFFNILLGHYAQPRIESRIVLFLDLRDSTPIAEALGSKTYFSFIRDFIYYVSMALTEFDANIYQYVGDEIVASWKTTPKNAVKCLSALIEARRVLQKHSNMFRRKYGHVPEFRSGVHAGEVTIGEIGVVKKDLAMSGDTMNTAARIRTASSELNQKFVVSNEFLSLLPLKSWQSKSLGSIDLKGKSDGMELFALRV